MNSQVCEHTSKDIPAPSWMMRLFNACVISTVCIMFACPSMAHDNADSTQLQMGAMSIEPVAEPVSPPAATSETVRNVSEGESSDSAKVSETVSEVASALSSERSSETLSVSDSDTSSESVSASVLASGATSEPVSASVLDSDASSETGQDSMSDSCQWVDSDKVQGGDSEGVQTAEVQPDSGSGHRRLVAPWPENKTIVATLVTSHGEIQCRLFAGTHPMTVLNFISLATGKPGWTDGSGNKHTDPYFQNIEFSNRVKGAYVVSGLRSEGSDFVIPDERCKEHPTVAGSIAMVQAHPGMASTQFMLMPRKNPSFKNMYIVFGQCAPIEIIDKITRENAILENVVIDEGDLIGDKN